MAAYNRPVSAASSRSQLSVSTSGTSYFSVGSLRPSSLEDILVKEYLEKMDRSSTKQQHLPTKYKSPYAKTNTKDKQHARPPRLSPATRLQSTQVSRRSTSPDCSALQRASVHSSNGISDTDLNESNNNDNSGFSSSSKRNRPVSAPPGHFRHSFKNYHLPYRGLRAVPVYKRKSWIIRAAVYRNGTKFNPVKVSAPSIQLLLERCTEKLKLNMAARRVFLSDGTEAFEPKDIPHDADIYISTGEPFSDPFKNMKDHTRLYNKVTWTLNGLMLPADNKRGTTKLALSKRLKTLTEKSTVRILVFANGTGQNGHEIAGRLAQFEEFLDTCTRKLNLGSSAKLIYDWNGQKIEALRNIPPLDKYLQNSITLLRGPVWVSKGEGFSPTGVKMYIQGVLVALLQRLKSSKNYGKQLEHYMNGLTNEITQKEILSMSEEELYSTHEEVNEQIEELKTAIKEHKGQLSNLAPQLTAEQEQCASYVYQHIKYLPANSILPQGLYLKVYENGKDTGETPIYISKKELQNGSAQNPKEAMHELLQTIQQRLQHSADFIGLKASRLFDDKGQEIKNPLALQHEQKIWVSCGEDYRPPVDNVLTLNFDKVSVAEKDGNRIIYKALMDPDVLLPGYESWLICTGFPDNVAATNLQTFHEPETVDADSLFLQSKMDRQMTLHPSVMVIKRSRTTGGSGKNEQLDHITMPTCLSSNIWLITKTGLILSRALPQVCLAVGHPVKLFAGDGELIQGYCLIVQKRVRNDLHQCFGFGNKGCIYSKAYPEFFLTYLEGLNIREEVTHPDSQIQHGACNISHLNTDRFSSKETDANHRNQQLPPSWDAQLLPAGAPGETRHLTVALVKKLQEKNPKAAAQRWAIRHEGTSKPGQWKLSKVKNPLWNKLTYMWPVLPNGEINEDFNWPIQGSLIPNSPPLEKPCQDHPDTHVPLRLKVLRNGDSDQCNTYKIVGPNLSNMRKKHNVNPSAKKGIENTGKRGSSKEDNSVKVDQIELQQFLERCTLMMNLPSAARRLFNENGTEIFRLRDLERDQLVYASCGEHWINPQLSAAEHKNHLLLNNLESDVALIRHYCCLRNPDNLVLEVCGEIAPGAKLCINYSVAATDEVETAVNAEMKPQETDDLIWEDDLDTLIDSHTRAHRKVDALFTNTKYPWQQIPLDVEEDDDDLLDKEVTEEEQYRYKRKVITFQQIHHQQFEFVDGQIISCTFPDLVVGVAGAEVHAGVNVILVDRNPDDIHQRWKYQEETRKFHLAGNPELVLAISMPKVYPGMNDWEVQFPGCPIILQKNKSHINGAANQKWKLIPAMKTLGAFCTDQLDKEITAAYQASICTFTVTKSLAISQPGYAFTSSNGSEKVMTCESCARSLRGKRELTKTLADSAFFCATGQENSELNPTGPFKCAHVIQTDLTTAEAENTLQYLERMLTNLLFERSTQTISPEIPAAKSRRAIKIKAYKNGAGFKNGKLIIVGTFTMLLSKCTRELSLARPACKVYTMDGTVILTLSGLVSWAVNNFFKQNEQARDETTNDESQQDVQTLNEKSLIRWANPEDLSNIDEYLLCFILRNPIEVWVSCGEPFLSLQALQRSEKQEKIKWQQKEKIVTDLEMMRHKMRQLQGRRAKYLTPANMIPTKSPQQPVLVEGGWTQETSEEKKLMKDIQNVEMHLSDIQAQHMKNPPLLATNTDSSQKGLYTSLTMKRVCAYLNGGSVDQGVFAWGRSMEELLDNCASRLNMQHHLAKVLYTPNGEEVTSWDEIKKDMVLCVSAGEAFMSKAASRQRIEVKANYARIRKKYGPEATDVIVSEPESLGRQVVSYNKSTSFKESRYINQ